jgi:anti-anti-sigma factor
VIVLDLSGVKMLDCGGLGALVFLHCWTRNNGIQLKLVNPSNFAREMFERTGLTCVLHVSSIVNHGSDKEVRTEIVTKKSLHSLGSR